MASGQVARNPRGWLINAAWRRAQELLDYQSRRPQSVSIEAVAERESSEPTPEQVALRHRQAEQLRWAMDYLPTKEREVVRMVYFEDLTLAEAGKAVGWSAPNTTRHHRAALQRMRSMLEGRVEEIPAIEIGLAAWIASNVSREPTWHSALEPLRDLSMAALDRAADLWRRVVATTEPATASFLSPTVRAAGVCSAAALACVAGGAVGAGAPAIDPQRSPAAETRGAAPQTAPRALSTKRHPADATPPGPGSTKGQSKKGLALERGRSAPRSRAARRGAGANASRPLRTSSEQTTVEFGIEGSPAATSERSASSPPQSAPARPRPPVTSARPAAGEDTSGGSGSGGAIGAEFGP